VNREALLAELDAHAAADAREAESLEWIRRFVAAPEDPFARDNPAGHVTASAVIARPAGDAFLLVFHRKLGRWLQPGGHVEDDDSSAFSGALREASEETGIRPDDLQSPLGARILDVDVHPIPARKNEPAHHHFDVRFLLTTRSEIDRAATDDPARPIEWRSWEAAMSLGVDESLARALTKARRVLS
jgi:8-oxo-dGTP pyrophosphatase MutT (NUDIX family)